MSNIIVSSGGTLSSATINTGVSVTVNAGASANSVIIDGGEETLFGSASLTTVEQGGFFAISAGTADNTTISSGGEAEVTFDGATNNATVEGGGTYVLLGSATGVTVSSGGTAFFGDLGTANTVDVSSGGLLVVSSGASISGFDVEKGGYTVLIPGATVSGPIKVHGSVVSAGIAIIMPGGSIATYSTSLSANTLSSGAVEYVLSGGSAVSGVVNSGASQQVFSGGSASGVTVSGAFETVNSGAFANGTVLDQGSVEYVYSGGSAAATVVNNGYALVDSGGSAVGVIVNDGGNVSVDGIISGTAINSGGSEFVDPGGAAKGTQINSGGAAYIYGTASNTAINAGAYEIVESGANTFSSGLGGTVVGEMVGSGGVLIAYGADAASGVSGGMISHGTIASGGIELLFAGAVDVGTTVESGGIFIPLQGAVSGGEVIKPGATVVSTGVVMVQSPATVTLLGTIANGLTLTSGMADFVLSRGSASGTAIGNHGYSEVDSGGTETDTIIQGGGVFDVAMGGTVSGRITFSGSGGTLEIAGPSLTGAVVSGFAAGDTINFGAINSGTGTVSVTSGNLLEVTNGSTTETVQLAPDFNAATLVAATTSAGTSVTIPQSSIQTPIGTVQPVSIPLYVLPFGTNNAGNDQYKIGIQVSLNGGASYNMYEFDTGGTGFFSSYNPSSWSSYTPVGSTPFTMSYTSGWHYTAQAVSTNVTFQTTNGGTLTVNNANVGLISSATDGNSDITPQQWNSNLTSTPATPPLETNFYGDFGMGLGYNNGLTSVLSQIPGGLSNGFIITLGNYPNNTLGQVGSVQVGLTQADINSFTTIISMRDQNFLDPSANSGEPTYTEVLANGTLMLSNGSASSAALSSGFVFDTGAPSTEIHEGTSITAGDLDPFVDTTKKGNAQIVQGTTISLGAPAASDVDAGTSGWNLSFQQGENPGQNVAGISTADTIGDPFGYVNTGLNAFFGYRIMFDLADGIMGFQALPCFVAGTRIMTPSGEVDVAELQQGDVVLTAVGEARPTIWVGRRHIDCLRHPSPEAVLPVCIAAHAFGAGLPKRDLLLSPDHALFLEGALIPVKYLINGSTVAQVQASHVSYYHIELARHEVILAEGLPAETYLETGSRSAFANGGRTTQLHAEFAPGGADRHLHWEAAGYAPLAVTGPAVERAKLRLRQHEAPVSGRVRHRTAARTP